jgi:hypothetical protein
MPFSTACNTPLSNFEANQNYKDVVDPAGTFDRVDAVHHASHGRIPANERS